MGLDTMPTIVSITLGCVTACQEVELRWRKAADLGGGAGTKGVLHKERQSRQEPPWGPTASCPAKATARGSDSCSQERRRLPDSI